MGKHIPGTLITVSGPDGSGKSTQIALLLEALTKAGLGVTSVWFRPGYSALMDRARAAVRRGAPAVMPTAKQSESRTRAFGNPRVQAAWIAMAFADSLVHYEFALRAALYRHDVVVCDRHIGDAELDLVLRFPDFAGVIESGTKALTWLSPKPALQLLYQVPLAVAVERSNRKQEPFPDPLEVRQARHAYYDRLALRADVCTVDAQLPCERVHSATLALVQHALPAAMGSRLAFG
jgi:thymidylate kinase